MTDEAPRPGVKDHDPQKLQVAVAVIFESVGKETGRCLRVDQFWPKILNLARENLRSLDGQKPGFCSVARRVLRPVRPRSPFSQLDGILGRETDVDREISIVNSLGVECRKEDQKESKKNPISSAHRDWPVGHASGNHRLDTTRLPTGTIL